MKKDRLSLGLAITAVIALGLAVCFPFFRFSVTAPEIGALTWSALSLIPSVWLLARRQVKRSSLFATLIFTVLAIFLSVQAWLANDESDYVFFQLDSYMGIELAALAAFTGALLTLGMTLRAPQAAFVEQVTLPKTTLLGALALWLLALSVVAFSPFMFFTLHAWIILLGLAIYAATAFFCAATTQVGKKRLYTSGLMSVLILPLYSYLQYQIGGWFSAAVGDPLISSDTATSISPAESTLILASFAAYLLLAPLLATGLSALLAIWSAKSSR